ncbi:MAG: hypothetical protein KGL39_16580 [Patescibacteria group bacterium]|nr:hypothetical protein [Patescibacteria group bacterium]
MKAAEVLVELNRLETETAIIKADIYDRMMALQRIQTEITDLQSDAKDRETARDALRAVYEKSILDEQGSQDDD